jgi:hypothetical protein
MGADGPIIREEGRRYVRAVGIRWDGKLEVINKDEEEEGTEDTALGYSVLDAKPAGVLRCVHTPHASIGEEGVQPQPGLAVDTGIMDSMEEDGMIDAVERLLDVEKQDRTLRGFAGPLSADNTLDGGEEIVNGVSSRSTFAEAELGGCEVVACLQLLSKEAMDEVLECANDDGSHADGAVGARLALIPRTFVQRHDICLSPSLWGNRVSPWEGVDGSKSSPHSGARVFQEDG